MAKACRKVFASISERDDAAPLKHLEKQYADAVARGDRETALQLIRQAAAKAMPNTKVVDKDGLPKVVHHCTDAEFTKFRNNKDPYDIDGFYFFEDFADHSYGETALECILNIENPIDFGKDIAHTGDIEYIGDGGVDKLKSKGYDGAHRYGFEWIAFYPNQIKLADITYDDNNLIPLSQRFDPTSSDIRY